MALFPIEQFEKIDTPFYYYDTQLLQHTIATIHQTAPKGSVVHYALKANSHPALLSIIAQAGLGADCVSGGEIRHAINAGITPDKIVYSGVGKTDKEIAMALQVGIDCFNVESSAELEVINDIAGQMQMVAPIAIRINPHIDAHTHHYITTGTSENKFGIDITQMHHAIEYAQSLRNITLRGLHFHIGSQITSVNPFIQLCNVINKLQKELLSKEITIDYINVGGGLGVNYENPDIDSIPDFQSYFDTFAQHIHLQPGQTLHFELGRSVVCQCGTLIARILYIKEGLNKRFAIIDAGMTDLMRPALYQASHKIENLSSNKPAQAYDVVGPICESSDSFGTGVWLNEARRGDFIAIRSAGAYGQSMASQYNSRELPGTFIG